MMEHLYGNKNIPKILLFLFVNGKGYGTQIQKILKQPLTPIQKAFLRLEKGGIIVSYYEGKTRVYQFNPAYPLLPELESLLKKTYTLLSPHEKKQYCFVKLDNQFKSDQQIKNTRILNTIWEKLSCVKTLVFHAKTKSTEETGWNGKGKGEVTVIKENDNVLIFYEKGTWKGEHEKDASKEMDFSNVFRWSFDRIANMISLEHLRRGLNNPVFLFHLVPSGNQSLASIDAHLCGGDSYFGQIFNDSFNLRLNWRVIGPNKNEEIDYYYVCR